MSQHLITTQDQADLITRSTSGQQPELMHSRTKIFPASIKEWNKLPAHVVESATLESFRTSLHSHFGVYQDTGDQCGQLVVATLVPSTPICSFFNLVKL